MGDVEVVELSSRTCEACGFQLRELKCKLVCERCGYFRSCSELF